MSTAARSLLATVAIIAGVVGAGQLVFAALILPLYDWLPRFSLNLQEVVRPGIAPLIATRTSPPLAVVLAASVVDLAIACLVIDSVFGFSDGLTGIAIGCGLSLVSAGYWSIVGNVPGRVVLLAAPIVVATVCRWLVEFGDRWGGRVGGLA